MTITNDKDTVTKEKLHDFSRRFEFETLPVSELHPLMDEENKTITGMKIGGTTYKAGRRFMRTMGNYFGFTENIFQYFTPDEVITRIVDKRNDAEIRICVDRKAMQLNGVTNPDQEILPLSNVCSILADDRRLSALRYDPVTTELEADLDLPDEWKIAGDSKYNTFLNFRYAVDHCKTPSIALGMLRQVCSNGLIAMKRCFETDLVIEKKGGQHLQKLLASFNNRNGFDALRERLTAAQHTKASVNEFLNVVNLIRKSVPNSANIVERLHQIAGCPEDEYGQTRLDNIRSRYRKELPVSASVMDLINIMTEFATHYQPSMRKNIDAYATNMLAGEFDLEELVGNKRPARDFYMNGVAA